MSAWIEHPQSLPNSQFLSWAYRCVFRARVLCQIPPLLVGPLPISKGNAWLKWWGQVDLSLPIGHPCSAPPTYTLKIWEGHTNGVSLVGVGAGRKEAWSWGWQNKPATWQKVGEMT